MITTFLDKGCETLTNSLGLKLSDEYSALWFYPEGPCNSNHFLQFILSTFDSFSGYHWLVSSGGAGSEKILNIKRAFGHWSIPKKDIVSMHDYFDNNGDKLYSDIAEINDNNIGKFVKLIDRHLFGIDSTLFFLPKKALLPSTNIANALTELFIKRNSLDVIDETLLNCRLIEKFIMEVTLLDGISTITLRDSNMSKIIVAIGNRFTLNNIAQQMTKNFSSGKWKHILNDVEFERLLKIGISLSILN